MKKKPLNEGSTRGQVKNGVNKPIKSGVTPVTRPSAPPPSPKKKSKD